MKTLTIRVSDEEHALMVAAAAKRFMTITGMVRAHFHAIFEQDDVAKKETTTAEPTKPRVMHPQPTQTHTKPPVNMLPNPWAHLPEPNFDD